MTARGYNFKFASFDRAKPEHVRISPEIIHPKPGGNGVEQGGIATYRSAFFGDAHLADRAMIAEGVAAPSAAFSAENVSDTAADVIADGTDTTATLGVGQGHISSQIDANGDRDWIKVDLVAGRNYSIRMIGSDRVPLENPLLSLMAPDGVTQVASNDNAEVGFDGHALDPGEGFGAGGSASHILFKPSAGGTYYIQAGSSKDEGTGGYTVLVDEVPEAPVPWTSIAWGGRTYDNTISVYFVGAEPISEEDPKSFGWLQWQIDQAMAALKTFEGFTNLQFEITSNPEDADFKLVNSDLGGSGSAMFTPPGEGDAGVGFFSIDRNSFLDYGSSDLWSKGSGAWHTLIHEFGHGLGLSHTHDAGGLSNVMEGVAPVPSWLNLAGGTLGAFNLNEGPYTMMSYNGDFPDGPNGPSPSHFFGFNSDAGALDMALLQRLYGANMNYNTGDDIYDLPLNNDKVVGNATIWDAGGNDTIRYSGQADAVIDLRPATLEYEVGGGGFVSSVDRTYGVLTIANGVTIENAVGGAGWDRIIGNSGDNVLDGGAGIDVMIGGGGDDVYMVDAGEVPVELAGGGNDTVLASSTWTLGAELEGLELQGTDSIAGYGNLLDNRLIGNAGASHLDGGFGNDTINGREGADTLVGGLGADTFMFDAPLGFDNIDTILDFSTLEDRLSLDNEVFSCFAEGTLSADLFSTEPSAAEGDRIVYDFASGALSLNRDEAMGPSVQFATLSPGLDLTAEHILIV